MREVAVIAAIVFLGSPVGLAVLAFLVLWLIVRGINNGKR